MKPPTRVLGLDPGSNMGFADDIRGKLEWGVVDCSLKRVSTEGLRWLKFCRWFESRVGFIPPGEVLVCYEEQNNFNRENSSSADVGKIMTAFILKVCEERGIACEAVPNGRLKTFAIPARPRLPKGEKYANPLDRGKEAMIAAAVSRIQSGPLHYTATAVPPDLTEHEADALWLYWYAKDRVLVGEWHDV